MKKKTRVYHSPSSNLVRILYLDGTVEALDLNIKTGDWFPAANSHPGDYNRALRELEYYVTFTHADLIEAF